MAKIHIDVIATQVPDAPKKKKKSTSDRLIFILDQSTSMGRMQEEAIAGFNEYVAEQKKVKGKAKLTLVLFDSKYQVVHDQVDINDVPLLTSSVYRPQGMTALQDAIGRTIYTYKDTAKKGEKTFVTILTDGYENVSKEYEGEAGRNAVMKLIKEVQDELKWEVMFTGAGIQVTSFATGLGIKGSKIASFDLSGKGVYDAISTLNVSTSYSRGDAKTVNLMAARGIVADANGDISLDAVYAANAIAPINPDLKLDDKKVKTTKTTA